MADERSCLFDFKSIMPFTKIFRYLLLFCFSIFGIKKDDIKQKMFSDSVKKKTYLKDVIFEIIEHPIKEKHNAIHWHVYALDSIFPYFSS